MRVSAKVTVGGLLSTFRGQIGVNRCRFSANRRIIVTFFAAFFTTFITTFSAALFPSSADASKDVPLSCKQAFRILKTTGPSELLYYQAIQDLDPAFKGKNPEKFKPSVGVEPVANGAVIKLLIENPHAEVAVVGDFNGWDHKTAVKLKPQKDGIYFVGFIPGLKHKMQYRILFNGKELLDPSATTYSSFEYNDRTGRPGDHHFNSVFWDFSGEGRYDFKYPKPDHSARPVNIVEVELSSLVAKWPLKDKSGNLIQVGPKTKGETYKFVTESGVINWLVQRGYNFAELLPTNPSVDEGRWQGLYKVYGNFGPSSRLGTPLEFSEMIDSFHAAGMGVIADSVVSHFPTRGQGADQELNFIGMHHFTKADGTSLFQGQDSGFQTSRYKNLDPHVRQFLTDGILTGLLQYNLDGLRIDNLYGLLHTPGGSELAKQIDELIKTYLPQNLSVPESHEANNLLTRSIIRGGGGANASTFSSLFNFSSKSIRKYTEQIDLNRLEAILNHAWSASDSMRVAYIANHDESSNDIGDFTGAYPASLLEGGGDDYSAAKILVYEALAMVAGSHYLGTPQARLGQKGNFETNSSIDYSLQEREPFATSMRFIDKMSRYRLHKNAFAPQNRHGHLVNHIDNVNKVATFELIDFSTGKKIIVLINFSHYDLQNYNFGVDGDGQYEVVLDNKKDGAKDSTPDSAFKNGTHLVLSTGSPGNHGNHGKTNSLTLPHVTPFQIFFLEKH